MINAIGFSIWGEDPTYVDGALANIEAAKEIYPGWSCFFFVQDSVPIESVVLLSSMGGQIVFCRSKNPWEGLFHRFLLVDNDLVETCIIRDTDSLVNVREQAAVNDWLNNSGKSFHIMRDHPQHCVPILGGMWGFTKRNGTPFPFYMREVMKHWLDKHPVATKGPDQQFLAEVVWPYAVTDHITHESVQAWPYDPLTRPFPKHAPLPEGMHFVGEIIKR